MEELQSLKGIGEKSAQKIIKRRKEKGADLTLEDLKMMTDIPNTIWDPLIKDGIITIELSDETPVHQTNASTAEIGNVDQINKMMEQIQSLQKNVVRMEKEKDLMKLEFDHKLNAASIDFKIQLKNKDHDYMRQQDDLERKYRENISKIKMEAMDKEYQIFHMIEEKDNEIRKLKLRENTQIDDIFSESMERSAIHKAEKSSPEHEQIRTNGPLPPRLNTYDGKMDWRLYLLQFERISKKYKWSEEDKLDKLIECLRDRALKYFSTRSKTVQNDYQAMCKQMEERFGRKDLPNVIRRQLQELRQLPDESLEEYAERAQDLASDGYPGTPENFIQIVASDAFLKGCLDKKAALVAMDKDPVDLDRALQYVRSAITNQRIILGLKKTEVKRVTLQEASEQSESYDTGSPKQAIIRTVYKKGTTEPDISKFDARLRKIEEDLRDTKVSLMQIIDLLRSQNHDNRQRPPQRQASPRRSPMRNGDCYNCGEPGHFSAECGQPRHRSPQRYDPRSRSPIPESDRGSLNFKGLKP